MFRSVCHGTMMVPCGEVLVDIKPVYNRLKVQEACMGLLGA